MTADEARAKRIEIYQNNINLLDSSLKHLKYSYDKCSVFDFSKELSFEDMEMLEAFTSRFARSVDILTQKVMKSIAILSGEHADVFLDRARLMEKLKLCKDAGELSHLRDLRNQEAHEYQEDRLIDICQNILTMTPCLFETFAAVKTYQF